MKILFANYSLDITGADLVLLSLIKKLPWGSTVLMLSRGPLIDIFKREGIKSVVISTPGRLLALATTAGPISRIAALWRLPILVKQIEKIARDYDLLYVNSTKVLPFVGLAAKLAKKPLIWHQHDPVFLSFAMPWRQWCSTRLIIWTANRFVTRLISVSRVAADAFIAHGGKANLPVVIHNGVDPKPFIADYDVTAKRTEMGFPENRAIIGCFGQLMALKGQWVLIEALHKLPDTNLVIVGGPAMTEPQYFQGLRQRVCQLGLSGRVRFLGHREDVPALMRSVDLIVHTTIESETFGLVVVEGMLAGRPVVATNVGGIPELIEDGVCGLLVPPGDPKALEVALRRILTDTKLAARLGIEGRKRALRLFALDRVVKDVQGVIHQTVTPANVFR